MAELDNGSPRLGWERPGLLRGDCGFLFQTDQLCNLVMLRSHTHRLANQKGDVKTKSERLQGVVSPGSKQPGVRPYRLTACPKTLITYHHLIPAVGLSRSAPRLPVSLPFPTPMDFREAVIGQHFTNHIFNCHGEEPRGAVKSSAAIYRHNGRVHQSQSVLQRPSQDGNQAGSPRRS